MSRTGRRTAVAAIAAVVSLCLLGAAAGAETALSRTEYVQQLETICKPRSEATARATRGARKDVKDERFKVAGRKFARGASIFGRTVQMISRVPRPTNDTARLKKWFGYLKKQEAYLTKIAVQLRAERAIKAQRLIARFIHNGNLANRVTLAFSFNYCSFRFSRYG